MRIEVTFPGGVAVNALVGEHEVRTDQPEKFGGEGAAPTPFDLFLSAIASCAGFYALRFCQKRGIDTKGLSIWLDPVRGSNLKRVERVVLSVQLPPGFPDKYRTAILRSIDHCAVKQHIVEPPSFDTRIIDQTAAA